MKTIFLNLFLICLVFSVINCSNRRKGAFLLPLGQLVQDTVSPQDGNLPSQPSSTQANNQSDNSNNKNPPPPTISFHTASSSVTREYDSNKFFDVNVNLSNTQSQTVNVQFTGSITSGPTMFAFPDHYSLPTSNTLVFNIGETTKSIQVLIKGENNIGCENYSSTNPHVLTLTLFNPSNVNLGNITVHNLTIWRNGTCE